MPRAKRFRLTPPALKESDVVKSCLGLLRLRGYYPVRIPAGLYKTPDGLRWVQVGEPGIPDYIAIHERYPGFFLETKRPGKKLDDHQLSKVDELRLAYRLAVAAVDSAEMLLAWLDSHETSFGKP